MSKSILVIDTPSNCAECQFCGWGGRNLEKYVCCLTKEHSEEPHLVGCPLKPMPKKQNYSEGWIDNPDVYCTEAMKIGWNACLEEIEE